ncbi:hypothetical protein [Parafrankia discariae]|uniref:hypothetical protein n=1 Tax=Parafrankia discariae TaxID=365528 RepID=UPI0003695482|nr:hypothetical protein [Parafrankia discariae]
MGTEIALRPTLYRGGQVRIDDGYRPPRDTCDPRWGACTEHRPGCDCREAEHAEYVAELLSELRHLREVVEGLWRYSPADVRDSVYAAVYRAALTPYEDARAQGMRQALYRLAHDTRLSPDQVRAVALGALNAPVPDEGPVF